MKRTTFGLIALILIAFFACKTPAIVDKQKIMDDIRAQESAFQKYLATKGAAEAFYAFAADDAAILRDSLIVGKQAIKNYYGKNMYKNAVAEWAPDFIDVSKDGTMAYTYGKYNWTFTDSTGKKTNYKGVFHTVWKKMPDNTWKFVWD